MEDGIFASKPTCIAQTADGYIWLGTGDGLLRFDGVRFTPWIPPNGQKLADARIFSLLAGKDGSLWIGTRSSLLRLVNGTLTSISTKNATVESIIEAYDGVLWITRGHVRPTDKDGGLCSVSQGGMRCYGPQDGIPELYASQAIQDRLGNLWIASNALTRWRPGSATVYNQVRDDPTKNIEGGPQALAMGDDGSLWVGMLQPGPGLGLEHLVNDKFSSMAIPGFDSSKLRVATLYTGGNGDLWVGTMAQGMYRIHGSTVSHFGAADGLSSDAAYNFFEDKEGDLWVITSEGLDRFRNLTVATYSIREGLTAAKAVNVVASRDGSVFVGNYYAIDILRSGGVVSLGVQKGFPGTLVTTMFEDRDRRLWAGIDDKLFTVEHDKFRLVDFPNNSPLGSIYSIAQDSDGVLWLSNDKSHTGKLFQVRGSTATEQKLPPETEGVFSLAADPRGGLWLGARSGALAHLEKGVVKVFAQPAQGGFDPLRMVATISPDTVMGYSTAGLLVFRNGVSQRLSSQNGLPCKVVSSFITDLHGNLFVNMQCGILRISRDELERWWKNPKSPITYRQFGPLDGARTELANLAPAAARSPDGKLWFVNDRVLQEIDPERLEQNKFAPPVAIEAVTENGKRYETGPTIRFPPNLRSLQIDYTALSFVVPQKVLFRYRLDGHDAVWQDAGARRQAFYNDLAPGRYQFHVIACNDAGIWNETGATMTLIVAPTLYQRVWFKVALALLFVLCLCSFYLMRIKQATDAVHARLRERLAERERIARELHDTLLQGFHGLALRLGVTVQMIPQTEPVHAMLEDAMKRVDEVLVEGRRGVNDLRAEQNVEGDIAAEFEQTLFSLGFPDSVDCKIVISGVPVPLIPRVRYEISAIGREALTNAFRHSMCSSIRLEVQFHKQNFCLLVKDDGKGISSAIQAAGRRVGHWGLAGMRERATSLGGSFDLISNESAGTTIKVAVPSQKAYSQPQSVWSWQFRKKLNGDSPTSRD